MTKAIPCKVPFVRQAKRVSEDATGLIKYFVDPESVEESARNQILEAACMPFVGPWIAVMPDVHAGMGCSIGTVVPVRGAVAPSLVGVDIACGVSALKMDGLKQTDFQQQDLERIYSGLLSAIPHGRSHHGDRVNDKGAWGKFPRGLADIYEEKLKGEFEDVVSRVPDSMVQKVRSANNEHHFGTLGTGNHFLELTYDIHSGDIWLLCHSGSRGIGNCLASGFITEAKKLCKQWLIETPPDLAYLPEGTNEFWAYITAIRWATKYAYYSRAVMLCLAHQVILNRNPHVAHHLMDILDDTEYFSCHHNYMEREHHHGSDYWVIRKGAIRARKGDRGIIPGSMGSPSFIVEGKGNPDSLHSASHGAGREMSRTKARATFSLQDHVRATEGVICAKDESVLDETPYAYKDIRHVMKQQEDLVSVQTELRQLICLKG